MFKQGVDDLKSKLFGGSRFLISSSHILHSVYAIKRVFAQCQADVVGIDIASAIAIVSARILMNSSLGKEQVFQLPILSCLKQLSVDTSLEGSLWR